MEYRPLGKEERMGQPHEDLQTLYAMKGRLEETGEMAKTLGLDNGGEAGNIYQALVHERAAQIVVKAQNRYRSMSNELNPKTDPDQPMVYEIRLRGHLGRGWADWFGDVAITLQDN